MGKAGHELSFGLFVGRMRLRVAPLHDKSVVSVSIWLEQRVQIRAINNGDSIGGKRLLKSTSSTRAK